MVPDKKYFKLFDLNCVQLIQTKRLTFPQLSRIYEKKKLDIPSTERP